MNKQGFSAVEVMATLIIAAILLFAGYQLFGVVYDQQLNGRIRYQASNIAYAYLRKKANNLSIEGCNPSKPIKTNEVPDSDTKLPNIEIKSIVSAPYGCNERIRRIEIQVFYKIGSSKQVETQVLYVDKTSR
ncbi:MAG: prepilin-type N-terminal cleavage/methylation domain-containing protein [Candidatus Saccharibacteria bacterium]|nr:prepilin-type N-terminal cleavage/methylation domain-containing protein [Candidatus Saccharibacteria bacterium]